MPRSKRHYRVTLADAIGAHERALEFGGRPGIHDLGLIESAIARPYTGYYRSIHRKAAALAESVALNHGFIDGNKRTAVYLTHLILSRSGYKLMAASDQSLNREVEKMILDVVEHRLTFDQVVDWFREHVRKK